MADQRTIARAIASLSGKPAPKRNRTKTPGYREAIRWIARNDDLDDLSEGTVTVALVADLFDRDPTKVVKDILDLVDAEK